MLTEFLQLFLRNWFKYTENIRILLIYTMLVRQGHFPGPPPHVFEFFSIGKVRDSFVQKCAQQFNVCARFPFEILEHHWGGGGSWGNVTFRDSKHIFDFI